MSGGVDQLLRKAASFAARGQIADADAAYRSILSRFPNNRRAQDGLAALATSQPAAPSDAEVQGLLALFRQGRLDELLAQLAPQIAAHPAATFLHNLAGAAYAGTGRLVEAIGCYDRAITFRPDFAEAWSNRGIALQTLGRVEDALDSHDTAIRLRPDQAAAWSNRGNALQALGRLDEAADSYAQAILLKPDHAEAHSNRGILLKELKRLDEALDHIDAAIALNPGLADAHSNRGAVLLALGRPADALDSHDRAIALRPDFADAHGNRGVALLELQRLDEALAAFDHAIRLRPGHADAHYNRGNALQELKRLDEALDSYRAAVALGSGQAEALNQLFYQKARMCDWSEEAVGAVDRSLLGIATDAVTPFAPLIWDDDARRSLLRARAFSAQRHAPSAPPPPPPDIGKARLRIGYFSADFHDHATMYLMAKLFETHDRARFDIHAFSYGPDRQDMMRARLTRAVDAFHDVRAMTDPAIAALAREQAIDIAIDLKGYTRFSRSGIFAHRAAPIQINYLGFPGSMGADFIDYIVADRIVIPEDRRGDYAEKILCLPGSYQVNDDSRVVAEAPVTRAALGLPDRGFVFCSFNNSYKISPVEFDIWMRLLGQVAGSVLWLLRDNDRAEANLRREAAVRGIDPARLIFAGRAPLADHLARHRAADLFLDSFNVNAHTTASDALWAALPLITRPGDGFAARVAASLLHAVGLPELVTGTVEEYERLALALATDPARLSAIRARLAANRSTTTLFDTERFTRHIEAGYELAYDRYFDGLPPDHIDVPAIDAQARARRTG